MSEQFPIMISVTADDVGKRLDQFLGRTHDRNQPRPGSATDRSNRKCWSTTPQPRPPGGCEVASVSQYWARQSLRRCARLPEEIPLDIVYEDDDLAVVNKPAGMMVHAGAGASEDRVIAARW